MYIKYENQLINLTVNQTIKLYEERNEIVFISGRDYEYFKFDIEIQVLQDDRWVKQVTERKGLAKKIYELICNCIQNPKTDYLDIDWYLEHGNLNSNFK